MNYLSNDFKTVEEGKKDIERAEVLYNSLGGTWYKDAVYDDLQAMKNKLAKLEREEGVNNGK